MEEAKSNNELNPKEQVEEKSFFSIVIHSFFIIPFLIAVFCALLFAGIHLLTSEQRTAYDYLEDVKTGGLTKRWQGAFELSRILANPDLIPKEERFAVELMQAFKQAKHDDHRTRQYIALAMGRTGKPEFVKPLVDGLKEEQEINVPSLIYALGMLKQKEAVPALSLYAEHSNSRIRSIAIVALGNIADPDSKNILKEHLKDSEPNVQWGAAIALARMEDNSGKAVLHQMLDRNYWLDFSEVDNDEQNNLVLTAVHASAVLNDLDLNEQIRQLAQTDPNMKVRVAALNFLK